MLSHATLIRVMYVSAILLLLFAVAGLYLLLATKEIVYKQIEEEAVAAEPFPVGVDPVAGVIVDTNFQNNFAEQTLAEETEVGLLDRMLAFLSREEWYQNLASPISRIVVIWPGQRKEEIATHIGDILRWDTEERERFIREVTEREPVLPDGTFYPGKYVTHRGATPEEMSLLLNEQFSVEIHDRYTDEVEAVVPLEEALVIASLLEREASDFENMREISGVIWNRLFIDMPLQLDATLQYAKATENSSNWWPVPRPADKFITSPYNTYQNEGLPPAPIGNPSANAVLAALNPKETSCFYYFHDSGGGYFCSETYEEHVEKLKAAYGRGR